MADATRSQLLTELNIAARDGSNITFTAQEKTKALNRAIHDPYVVKLTRDTSITTDGSDSYDLPFTGTILKLGIQMATTGKPANLEDWDVIDGTIYLPSVPPSGKTLVIIGTTKLDENDLIPDDRQEYVLVLAKIQLINYLTASLATTFLTNDMSMGELLRLKQDLQAEAATWRSSFRNSYTVEL